MDKAILIKDNSEITARSTIHVHVWILYENKFSQFFCRNDNNL